MNPQQPRQSQQQFSQSQNQAHPSNHMHLSHSTIQSNPPPFQNIFQQNIPIIPYDYLGSPPTSEQIRHFITKTSTFDEPNIFPRRTQPCKLPKRNFFRYLFITTRNIITSINTFNHRSNTNYIPHKFSKSPRRQIS